MAKYLFLYSAPPSVTHEQWQPSPQEMQATFAQWKAWKEKFKAQVVDVGDGLKPAAARLKNGEVTDGPFPEAKEIVNGYSVIEAKSLQEAIAVARECPITLMPNSSTAIHEMMGY
jgi:hypothetical protein